MSDLAGYVNPRSLGNKEPNELFGMDIFFEQQLWDKCIFSKDESIQNVRTWDVCWKLRSFIHFERQGDTKLRAYIHPSVMALCVGLAVGDK